MIAALHWNEVSSDKNNKVLASGFPGADLESSIPGSAVNVQFMVKDSKRYAATGGWGFADFTNGKSWQRGAAQNLLPLPPTCERARLRLHTLRANALY